MSQPPLNGLTSEDTMCGFHVVMLVAFLLYTAFVGFHVSSLFPTLTVKFNGGWRVGGIDKVNNGFCIEIGSGAGFSSASKPTG
jgi:hypothetical protein